MSIDGVVDRLLERLSTDEPINPSELEVGHVPRIMGVYVWYGADKDCPAYIGKATGKAGLRGRIMRQHLNAKYLETRESRITAKDHRQLKRGTMHNARPAIEKSMFRKHLARQYDLAPGHGTIDFINAHFKVLILPLPALTGAEIREVEDALVHTLNPSLNVVGSRSRNN